MSDAVKHTPDPIDDRMGEALRRYRNGEMRPLWVDMPEGHKKQAWRVLGRKFREQIERCGLTVSTSELEKAGEQS